jgi:tetratricopeptide (TPR) repeat protein
VEYCKKALEHKKDATIYNLMGMAFATHLKFRHEALDAYQKALEIDPRNAEIYANIADLYFFTENFALARANYQKVLKFQPNNPHATERLQEIAQKLKK